MNNLKYKNFYTKYITKYEIHGKDMVCICPFHDENTASMHIDLIQGGYHCFGCSIHVYAQLADDTCKFCYGFPYA